MKSLLARSSPVIAVLTGLVAASLWVLGLQWIDSMSWFSFVRLLTAGAVGAVGASLGTVALTLTGSPDQQRYDQVEHQAKHDALTGLTNRAEMFVQLDRAIKRAKREDMILGVLFLDLNRFKIVNDTLGHEIGDELLKVVAHRLKSTVRNTDIVARLGGDEFVVICRDMLSRRSVTTMAEQILKRFNEPVSLKGKEHRIGTSIGVVIALPDDDRDGDELVRDADAAMYDAKSAKAGYVVFDEARQQRRISDRLDVERELHNAIEANQLVVLYQPIVDVDGRVLYGFEALLRWNHPERGMLGPGLFLPVAQDAGLLTKIGEYVLREACAQAAVWNHLSPGARQVVMSVNVAEQQLLDPGFRVQVADILHWAGLAPSQLALEISEDVIVDRLDNLDGLRELRQLGVNLSIDDFGTGQASLGFVKKFDMVTSLKIDQVFVRDMKTGKADRAIIEAVIAMASALGLKVVAEGVEDEEQVKQLQDMGISLMQGFVFNTPVSPQSVDPGVWFPAPVSDKPVSEFNQLEISRGFAQSGS